VQRVLKGRYVECTNGDINIIKEEEIKRNGRKNILQSSGI
jgi:hypothetical protein